MRLIRRISGSETEVTRSERRERSHEVQPRNITTSHFELGKALHSARARTTTSRTLHFTAPSSFPSSHDRQHTQSLDRTAKQCIHAAFSLRFHINSSTVLSALAHHTTPWHPSFDSSAPALHRARARARTSRITNITASQHQHRLISAYAEPGSISEAIHLLGVFI